MKMKGNPFILPGVDGEGVILLQAMCLVHRWEGRLSTTHSCQKMMGHLVMPPAMTGLFVRGVEVGEVRKAEVAVTPMIHAPH